MMTCTRCGQHYYIGSHCPICGHTEDDYDTLPEDSDEIAGRGQSEDVEEG